MVVYFPIAWYFWSFSIPEIGRVDRLIAIMGMVGMIFLALRDRITYSLPSKYFSIGVYLLFLGYLIAWFNHPNSSIVEFVGFGLRIIFLLLTYYLIQNRQQLLLVGRLLVIGGLIASVITLVANLQLGFGFFRSFGGAQLLESTFGIFSHIVLSGTFISFIAVLIFSSYSEFNSLVKKGMVISAGIFVFLMAFVSQYRRELIITIGLLMLLFIFDRYSKINRQSLIILIGLTVYFWFFALPGSTLLQDRLLETNSVLLGTDTRTLNFIAGINALKLNLLGYGPGNYESIVHQILGGSYFSWQYSSYNVFMEIAVEGGIISLIGFVLMISSIFIVAFQQRKFADGPEGWILRASPGILIIIMIWFTFGNAIDVSLPWYLFGIILAAVRLSRVQASLPEVVS